MIETVLPPLDMISKTDIALVAGITLLSMPLLALPVVLLLNFSNRSKKVTQPKRQTTRLSFEQIKANLSDENTPPSKLKQTVNEFNAHHSKIPTGKSEDSTKDKFALYVVLLRNLAKQKHATKELVLELGNALIKNNPVFKTDFEKRINTTLKEYHMA